MAESEVAICNMSLLSIGDTQGLIATLEDPSLQAQVCKLEYPQVRDELLAQLKWPRATRRAYPAQLGGDTYDAATTYAKGEFVSYAPSAANVVNMPETVSTFVYVSLADGNLDNPPDSSPAHWSQLSRAAWAYVFQIPADVIEVQGLYRYTRNPREDQQIPYALENDALLGTILLTDTGLPWARDWGDSAPRSIELIYTGQVTDPKQFPAPFTRALAWALAVPLTLALRKDAKEAAWAQQMADKHLAIARAAALREVKRDQPPIPSHIAARATSRGQGSR